MRVVFAFLCFLVFAAKSYSANEVYVEVNDKKFISKSYYADSPNTLITELSSSATDGRSTLDNPHIIYAPVYKETDGDTPDERLYGVGENPNLIFHDNTDAANSDKNFLSLPIKATPSSTAAYNLIVAVKGDTTYTAKKLTLARSEAASMIELSGSTSYTMTAYVNLYDICGRNETLCLPTGTSQKTFTLYVFLATAGEVGASATGDFPGTYPNGIFVSLKLSSLIHYDPTYIPVIDDITRGDGQLILDFTGANISPDPYGIVVLSHDSTTSTAGSTAEDLWSDGFEKIKVSDDYSYRGRITVDNLQNGVFYNLAIALIDKYQFATPFSDSAFGSPEEIETFLEKQACYLLSAGFQEEHFVLEYFKSFRDNILLRNFLGKKFVAFYYGTAPKFTPFIYKNPLVSASVRGVGYGLYYLFNYFWVIPLLLFLLALLRFRKNLIFFARR